MENVAFVMENVVLIMENVVLMMENVVFTSQNPNKIKGFSTRTYITSIYIYIHNNNIASNTQDMLLFIPKKFFLGSNKKPPN